MDILRQNLRLNYWWHSIIIYKLVYLIMSCCNWICIYGIVNISNILGACLCSILKSLNLWTYLISILIFNILCIIVNLLILLRGHLTLRKIWIIRLIKLTKLFPHYISWFWCIHISLLLRFARISSILLIFSPTILNSKIWLIIAIINIIIRCITI